MEFDLELSVNEESSSSSSVSTTIEFKTRRQGRRSRNSDRFSWIPSKSSSASTKSRNPTSRQPCSPRRIRWSGKAAAAATEETPLFTFFCGPTDPRRRRICTEAAGKNGRKLSVSQPTTPTAAAAAAAATASKWVVEIGIEGAQVAEAVARLWKFRAVTLYAPLAGKTDTARCAQRKDQGTAVFVSRLTPPSNSTTSKTALVTTAQAKPSIGLLKKPRLPLMNSRSFRHGSPLPLRRRQPQIQTSIADFEQNPDQQNSNHHQLSHFEQHPDDSIVDNQMGNNTSSDPILQNHHHHHQQNEQGGGDAVSAGFVFSSQPSPSTPFLQPLFGQTTNNQLFNNNSQRGPLQSSNAPSFRAWIDPPPPFTGVDFPGFVFQHEFKVKRRNTTASPISRPLHPPILAIDSPSSSIILSNRKNYVNRCTSKQREEGRKLQWLLHSE
ncbi:unnamed protein product [Lactuca saligna]|uniref:Uncharacterized protein n=1 Tax=Lactuca saligna TaxID=75948 RepID=A0AA35Z741_LACSI|nr:unnamed protein product [Lactuca saligna]